MLFKRKTLVELCVTALLLGSFGAVRLVSSRPQKTPPEPSSKPALSEEPGTQPQEGKDDLYAPDPVTESSPRVVLDLPGPLDGVQALLDVYEAPTLPRADKSYFDDALFVTDGLWEPLCAYASRTGALGKATFLCIDGYGLYEAVRPVSSEVSLHPLSADGKPLTPSGFAEACGAKKVYVALGQRDVGLYPEDTSLVCLDSLVTSLKQVVGDNVVLVGVLPLTLNGERKLLYNRKIDEFNVKMASYAAAHGCLYFDVASCLKDTAGYFASALSSDGLGLPNTEAVLKMVEYLYTH